MRKLKFLDSVCTLRQLASINYNAIITFYENVFKTLLLFRKPTPGTKIADLTNIIETQVNISDLVNFTTLHILFKNIFTCVFSSSPLGKGEEGLV